MWETDFYTPQVLGGVVLLTIQRQPCIKFRVLRAQDFYTPLPPNCQKGQHLPALVVYKKNQSPTMAVTLRDSIPRGKHRFRSRKDFRNQHREVVHLDMEIPVHCCAHPFSFSLMYAYLYGLLMYIGACLRNSGRTQTCMDSFES